MNALLSWQLWKIFLMKIFSAFFPAELTLVFFSLRSLKDLLNLRPLRILMIFISVDLTVRTLVFFAGAAYSGRYLLIWSISAGIIFATSGFKHVINFLHFIVRSSTRYDLDRKFIIITVLLTIASGYSLKALRLRHDKPWLQAVGKVIEQHNTTNKSAVIYTNYSDRRWGYYAHTELVYDIKGDLNNMQGEEQAQYIKLFAAKLSKLKHHDIFIIVRLNYHDHNLTDKSITQLFKLKILGEFTDCKHRKFNLYKFINKKVGVNN
jgi:hypothetical protein